jgi:hypothetical protein
MLAIGRWSPPVPVRTGRVGLTYNVTDANAALEQLWTWDHKNRQVKKAVSVCSAFMEGLATTAEARNAFEDAARATGNLMGTR